MNFDLDSTFKLPTQNFKLFMRLMEEKQYEGLLFADISAMTQLNRIGLPLKTMLKRTDLHHRLINGSDYPLPAINSAVSTRVFETLGFISSRERRALNRIYKRNPLLFDFVLKRSLKHPLDKEKKFAANIFQDHPFLQLSKPLKEDTTAYRHERRPAPAVKSGEKNHR